MLTKKILKKMKSKIFFLINNNAIIFTKTKIANKIIQIKIKIEKTISIKKNEVKIIQMIIISTSNLLLITFLNNLIIFFSTNKSK